MLEERPKIPADEVPFGCEAEYAATYDVVLVQAPVYDVIPPGLDALAPGPVLAGWLSSIDVSELSPFDRIVVLRAHDRLVSHYQALRYRDMVALADAQAETSGDAAGLHVTDEAAGAEVATALRMTRRGADVEMGFALDLFRRLPRLAAMLEAGTIDVARARVVERGTTHLSDGVAQNVVDDVADDASGLTTGELRARIRKLCIETDPDDARGRYEMAVEGRKVVMVATDAGTANLLGIDLAPDRVQAATQRIDMIARGMRGPSEARSMDQLRADVYLDILNGVDHDTAEQGVVELTVDRATLAGSNDRPGELAGYGPVIADVARRIAACQADTECRLTITDTEDGTIGTLAGSDDGSNTTDAARRYPTVAQRRRIETRDRVCVFPGCRIPSTRSDIDHILAIAHGGTTTDDNLAPLCRHHHRIKHEHGWTYRRLPSGTYQWTSPTGHTYAKIRPPP